MGRTSIQISEELADELHSMKQRGDSYEDVLWRLLERPEPELIADGGAVSPFPAAGSGERVAYDKSGSGPGNVTGHSVVHLLDKDGARPLCETTGEVESLPTNIVVAPRVDFDTELDECSDCARIAGGR